MRVLIVGGSGREHALAWKIQQSPRLTKLYVAPGNAGTAHIAENASINVDSNDAVVLWAKSNAIDLVVVQTDSHIAAGMVDVLMAAGIRVFGPTKAASKLEWSKAYAKDFMSRQGIPTAHSYACVTVDEALKRGSKMLKDAGKVVVKADGLARGKGVIIAANLEELQAGINELSLFGSTFVIEEFLEGEEVSIHAFCDGTTAKLFPVARDHKRIGDGNTGPNTGGMGTIAPVLVAPGFLEEVAQRVVRPVLRAVPGFKGVLFPGLMLTKKGFKVLEFNARLGDPETESYMRLLETDLLDIMDACIDGVLGVQSIQWSGKAVATVMMVSKGYPNHYETGFTVSNIAAAEQDASVVVFHANTALQDDTVITNGGRVMAVSAVQETVADARSVAYEAVHKIQFEGEYHRTDIGI